MKERRERGQRETERRRERERGGQRETERDTMRYSMPTIWTKIRRYCIYPFDQRDRPSG